MIRKDDENTANIARSVKLTLVCRVMQLKQTKEETFLRR
jgi:hypothetical protein